LVNLIVVNKKDITVKKDVLKKVKKGIISPNISYRFSKIDLLPKKMWSCKNK
jgi:hypothetical protein